jgi:hypothetical protein
MERPPAGPEDAREVEAPHDSREGTMPVGEVFLYGVWAAIAIAAMVASARILREH